MGYNTHMQFNPDEQGFDSQGEQEWNGPRQSFMVRLVMKTGLVRDESQANYVLISIAAVFFVLTVMVISGNNGTTPEPTYLEDIPEDVRGQLPPEILETIPSRN